MMYWFGAVGFVAVLSWSLYLLYLVIAAIAGLPFFAAGSVAARRRKRQRLQNFKKKGG